MFIIKYPLIFEIRTKALTKFTKDNEDYYCIIDNDQYEIYIKNTSIYKYCIKMYINNITGNIILQSGQDAKISSFLKKPLEFTRDTLVKLSAEFIPELFGHTSPIMTHDTIREFYNIYKKRGQPTWDKMKEDRERKIDISIDFHPVAKLSELKGYTPKEYYERDGKKYKLVPDDSITPCIDNSDPSMTYDPILILDLCTLLYYPISKRYKHILIE